jgi:hypothetical protein
LGYLTREISLYNIVYNELTYGGILVDNHFGKGLMAGLKAREADSVTRVTRFCSDYKRGFVLGFSHRISEQTGDRQRAAWEAGVLTRRYNLDKELVADFFKEVNADTAVKCFFAGYERGY